MPTRSLFVLIPVHNRKELTRMCLESLQRQSLRDFKIIVIDDGSSDGTSDMIKEQFGEVILLKGNGNLWWTGAINLGIEYVLRHAQTRDYVLLLNDDVVVDNDYMRNLLIAAELKPHSVIGSVQVSADEPNIIRDGGVAVDWATAKYRGLHLKENLKFFNRGHFEPVSILPGRGTLYPIEVFKRVGLFDKRFKQCGDTELSRRAFLKGYSLWVSYDAVVKTPSDERVSARINAKQSYRLRDAWAYFFDIRSNCRIAYRWYFSSNAFENHAAGAVYFLFDMARVTFHFASRLSVIPLSSGTPIAPEDARVEAKP